MSHKSYHVGCIRVPSCQSSVHKHDILKNDDVSSIVLNILAFCLVNLKSVKCIVLLYIESEFRMCEVRGMDYHW